MAFSGTVSATRFNALKVVDTAFRRCRLPAQAITPEMQQYALDALYLQLSNYANGRPPSWCIERVMLPMYENQPIVTLPSGTEDLLNVNYRTLQLLAGEVVVADPTSYVVDFETATVVNVVGFYWVADAPSLVFETSLDGIYWTEVGAQAGGAPGGTITWFEIDAAVAWRYFRVEADGVMSFQTITLGNMPQEIPLGVLNRDDYVNQSNKVFPGRPSNYWYQRDLPQPIMHLWPAPNAVAEQAQLIVWRQRQIMDTANLQQEVEVPQRWLEAICARLAAKVAETTPAVQIELIPVLEAKASEAERQAREGDNDGSSTKINPGIGVYTA
jgi:hypothetical protein